MAGVDQIVETIISQARDIAEEIMEAARENADKLSSISKEKVINEVEEIHKNSMAKSWEVEQRTLTMADLERRRFYLAAKQDVIDSVFLNALEKLIDLGDKDYFDFIPKLIVKNAATGEETISASANDNRIKKAVKIANDTLGDKGNLKVGKNAPIKGGFIMTESGVSVNCSYKMILRLKRDEMLSEVAAKLFVEDV